MKFQKLKTHHIGYYMFLNLHSGEQLVFTQIDFIWSGGCYKDDTTLSCLQHIRNDKLKKNGMKKKKETNIDKI